MIIKVTITKDLDDELWGFSDLLNGRGIKDAMPELIELLYEDIQEVLEGAKFKIEEIITDGKH